MITLARAQEKLAELEPAIRADFTKVLQAVVDKANREFTLPAHIFLHRIALDGDTVHITYDDLSGAGPLYFDEGRWTGPLLAHWRKQDQQKYANHLVTGLYKGTTVEPELKAFRYDTVPSEHLVVTLMHTGLPPAGSVKTFWLS